MAFESFFSADFFPVIQKYVEELRKAGKPFSTVELIRTYIGHYQVDKTLGYESINANIGKFLKENDKALGINEQAYEQPITIKSFTVPEEDTTTSIWEFN